MSHEHPLRVPRCTVCSSYARASTGECSDCGAYVCECGELHLGDASKGCPFPGRSKSEVRMRAPEQRRETK